MQTELAPSPGASKVAFTLKEAAHASGLSRSLLYVAIGRGALRANKCGARTIILDTELRRFLRKLPRLETSEAPPIERKAKRAHGRARSTETLIGRHRVAAEPAPQRNKSESEASAPTDPLRRHGRPRKATEPAPVEAA
jgi:hypothetical protein